MIQLKLLQMIMSKIMLPLLMSVSTKQGHQMFTLSVILLIIKTPMWKLKELIRNNWSLDLEKISIWIYHQLMRIIQNKNKFLKVSGSNFLKSLTEKIPISVAETSQPSYQQLLGKWKKKWSMKKMGKEHLIFCHLWWQIVFC